jgi:hypothetical protein
MCVVYPSLNETEPNPAMMVMTVEYRRGSDHVYRFIAGEHLLIALKREVGSPLFSFSDTGAVIWEALADWMSTDSLVQELLDRFDVGREVAAADVDHFLEQLRSISALQTRETPP